MEDVNKNEISPILKIEDISPITFIEFNFTPWSDVEFNTGFKPLN